LILWLEKKFSAPGFPHNLIHITKKISFSLAQMLRFRPSQEVAENKNNATFALIGFVLICAGRRRWISEAVFQFYRNSMRAKWLLRITGTFAGALSQSFGQTTDLVALPDGFLGPVESLAGGSSPP
jgi:hypothetical protein